MLVKAAATALPGAARSISAARIVPVPSGLVRISAAPGRAPDFRIGRSARPVSVKPSVSSLPIEVWPPTISAPAAVKTCAAACIISRNVSRLQAFGQARQGDLCQCRLRLGAHRPDVAQRVDRGDAGEKPGVFGEGAEVVGGDDLPGGPEVEHRRVVAGAGQDLGPSGCGQVGQRRGQRPVSDLGAAAAAERFAARQFLDDAGAEQGGQRLRLHRGQVLEAVHESPVDPVLPAPEPCAVEPQAEFVSHSTFSAGRDQFQVIALRVVAAHRSVGQGGAQVVVQDGRFAHREDAGLGARGVGQVGAVADGEDRRVRGLQAGGDREEALVQLEAG